MTKFIFALILLALIIFDSFFLVSFFKKNRSNTEIKTIVQTVPDSLRTESLKAILTETTETQYISPEVKIMDWQKEAKKRDRIMYDLLISSGTYFPGENPKFPLTLDYDKNSLSPEIINSGIVVTSSVLKGKILIDGKIDDSYTDYTKLKNDFFDDLKIYSVHDNKFIYFAFSFDVNSKINLYANYFKWETKNSRVNKYSHYNIYDTRRYNPYAMLFMDIYWEMKDNSLQGIKARRRTDFDLWCWQPSLSLERFVDDRSYKILFKLNKLPKGEPKLCFLSKGFTAFFIDEPDEGKEPYIFKINKKVYKGIYISDIMNIASPSIPSGSCSDIECRWSFNGSMNNFESAEKSNGIGKWVIEIRRKLNTGNPDDVDFTSRKEFRFFIPYFINLYSKKLIDENIYPPAVLKHLQKTNPYYTLKIVQ